MWPINAEEPDCQEEKLCDSSYFQYLVSKANLKLQKLPHTIW